MELHGLDSERVRRWAEVARHPVATARERVRHARTRVAAMRERIVHGGARMLSRRRSKRPEQPETREARAVSTQPVVPPRGEQPAQDAHLAHLLREVESELAPTPHVDAHDALTAVTCTLTARLSGGEARDLLGSLPLSIRDSVKVCERHAGEPGAAFGRDEFLRRVAEHTHASERDAERITVAVFRALRARLPVPDAADVDTQLPKDLKELWRAATPTIAPPEAGIAGTTATDHPLFRDIERSGALPELVTATQAFSAVMCTLLGRLPDDASAAELANALPLSVRELVSRCPVHRATRSPSHEDVSAAEFVRRVAEHLNVDLDTGEEITRAVFAAVQPVLPTAERDEVARELSEDLRSLWREPELRT